MMKEDLICCFGAKALRHKKILDRPLNLITFESLMSEAVRPLFSYLTMEPTTSMKANLVSLTAHAQLNPHV